VRSPRSSARWFIALKPAISMKFAAHFGNFGAAPRGTVGTALIVRTCVTPRRASRRRVCHTDRRIRSEADRQPVQAGSPVPT
jgi:hypothetical protein